MTYKICQAIFSTNRINYVTKVLESQNKLDFKHCEVTKIFFDDFPTGRNDTMVEALAKSFGYEHVILHQQNQGITRTWQELFNFIKERDFDYVWQQEDDAEVMHPIKIIDLIEILQDNPTLSQVQLRRDNWYSFETDPIGPKESDTVWNQYRIEHGNPWFWMMSSLYPAWIAKEPYIETAGHNPSEGVIAYHLSSKFNLQTGLLKTSEGGIMVNHFGEYTRGTKVAENEPGWDGFKNFDPTLDYDSKTGQLYNK